jgi:hypothetical protein
MMSSYVLTVTILLYKSWRPSLLLCTFIRRFYIAHVSFALLWPRAFNRACQNRFFSSHHKTNSLLYFVRGDRSGVCHVSSFLVFVSVTRQQHTLEGEGVEEEKQQKKLWRTVLEWKGGPLKIRHGFFVDDERHMYIVKPNYILGGMLFTMCQAQLHVSATNIGHLQVVQRKLINQIYTHLYGVFRVQGGGVSARSHKCGGFGFGLVRNHI